MSEFSDQPGFDSGTDFTDPVQDSPQTPEAPPSVSPTPEPKPGNVDKADSLQNSHLWKITLKTLNMM